MKLKAQLNNTEHELEFKLEAARTAVEIDGRKYQVDVRRPGPATYLLQSNHRVYECLVRPDRHAPGAIEVTVHSRRYSISISDPKRLRGSEHAGRHDHGSAEIAAPMPGKVVRVLVEVGAQVEAGAGILVVEAMKMQNEMKTPRAGVVVSLNASPGDTVNAGQVLAVVE